MCRDKSINQINNLIQKLNNAKSNTQLLDAQIQALSFIKAASLADELDESERQALEKKVRRVYRKQLIQESTWKQL